MFLSTFFNMYLYFFYEICTHAYCLSQDIIYILSSITLNSFPLSYRFSCSKVLVMINKAEVKFNLFCSYCTFFCGSYCTFFCGIGDTRGKGLKLKLQIEKDESHMLNHSQANASNVFFQKKN